MTSPCRFPPPWRIEQTPGGFKDAPCFSFRESRETQPQLSRQELGSR
jgi:hypothetical protein